MKLSEIIEAPKKRFKLSDISTPQDKEQVIYEGIPQIESEIITKKEELGIKTIPKLKLSDVISSAGKTALIPFDTDYLNKAMTAAKYPSEKVKEIGDTIITKIEEVAKLDPTQQGTFWKNFLKGVPGALARSGIDYVALRLSPEAIVASGMLKTIPSAVAHTKLGGKISDFVNKDISEILYRGRVKGMKEAAKAMADKFPDLRAAYGEEGIYQGLKNQVNQMGGWSKVKPDNIKNFITKINEYVPKQYQHKPIPPKPIEFKPETPQIATSGVSTPIPPAIVQPEATGKGIGAITTPITEPIIKQTIEKVGAKYIGIQESPDGKNLAMFNVGKQTKAVPVSEFSEEAVKAKVEEVQKIAEPTPIQESISKAKAENKSFDEFVKSKGETIYRGDAERLIPISEYDVEKGVRDI